MIETNIQLFHSAAAIAPSDTVDLPTISKGIYIGGAGNVKVDLENGGTVTFTGVVVGSVLQVAIKRVYATGTTATNLIALY